MNIKLDYVNKRCCIYMQGYIEDLLTKFKHPRPPKRRLLPYACTPISYGAKSQFSPNEDTLELLDAPRKLQVQEIVGSLLYYARAVENKLLVAISAISLRQAQATVTTEQAVHFLLD